MSTMKERVLELEAKGCFDFFWNEANQDPNSPGYGLIVDTTKKPHIASIASNGFGLAALVIGVERGYVSFKDAYERALGTLKTFRDRVCHVNGFYPHFLNMKTAERHKLSEFSTIDTAILLMGALVAGEFFGREVKEVAEELLNRTKWDWLVTDYRGKPVFRMSYEPERYPDREGWAPPLWDLYAEHLMMYFLAAGQEGFDPELALKLYFGFERRVGAYRSGPLVYCFGGALFTYQYSHAFIDFREIVDARGFDWFNNSVQATIANRNWCIDHMDRFKTYNEYAWGLTASSSKNGYKIFGAAPFGWDRIDYEPPQDGTIMPCGPAGSIPFLPDECIASLNYFYDHHPQLWGEYGFKDAYNLDVDPAWYADHYIGIDKGITLLMIDNYQHGTVWHYVMNSEYMKRSLAVLHFKKKK
ncbi:MAG TPA: glucoamylase family protein [Haloplasmataceae bacterium]